MTTDEWIQIAGVGAIVLGAIATGLVAIATYSGPVRAARISLKAQQNTTAHEGWIARVNNSSWLYSPWRLPVVVAVLYLVLIITDLRSTGPVTRFTVFHIAFHVVGVLWGGVLMVAFMLREQFREELRFQAENERIAWDFIGDILHIEKAIWQGVLELHQETLDIIESTATVPKEAVEDILDILQAMNEELEKIKRRSLRTTIKGLFGG